MFSTWMAFIIYLYMANICYVHGFPLLQDPIACPQLMASFSALNNFPCTSMTHLVGVSLLGSRKRSILRKQLCKEYE